MLRTSLNRTVVVALVVCWAAVGCRPKSKITTVPVSGKVTYKDVPLEGATVAFVLARPDSEASRSSPSSGVTNSDGVYKLVTFESLARPVDGAVPGKYKVTITKRAVAAPMVTGDPTEQDMSKMAAEMAQKMSQAPLPPGANQGRTTGPEKSEIPQRYSDPATTDLEANVLETGAQVFDFPLTD